MQKNHTHVVIMAGGIGSRFWPYSRNNHPKQFLDVLNTGRSLLQMTYQRSLQICPSDQIYVVTNELYGDLVKEQLPELSDHQILLEPIRRNTAPCIAYAAYKIRVIDPKAILVVAPSDHLIINEQLFHEKVQQAITAATDSDKLLTLGIEPNRPETGYGYIQYNPSDNPIKKVKTFTEKPSLDLAKTFVESGEFVWNAGIFIWSAQSIIKAFEKHEPELAEVFAEGIPSFHTDREADFIKKAYMLCKNISIDYAVLEKDSEVYVVLGDFGWSDLGSWTSLHELREQDENQNVIDANALTYDSQGCYIQAPKDKLIVIQGLEDYLVADTDNVLLICKKDAESKFRDFVADAKNKGEEYI